MKIELNKKERNWWAVVLGIGLIMQILSTHLVDKVYTNLVFQFFRIIYDYSIGLLPFPFIYIGVPLILYVASKYIRKGYSTNKKFGIIIYRLTKVIAVLYLTFYIIWGLNYSGSSLGSKMHLVKNEINSQAVFDEAVLVMNKINELRNELGDPSEALKKEILPSNTENILRKSLEKILKSVEIPTYGRVRVRKLEPKGVLLRTATAGIYFPYVFEGHIDAGLFEVQHPFTMAHEMSHGYGITNEGECNFMAILTCINSDDPYIMYSGLLSYWRYMANELLRNDFTLGKVLLDQRSEGVICDIDEIFKRYRMYPDILPDLRDIIYDQYLKSNGISEGLKSYGRVTHYMFSWKESSLNREIYAKLYD